MNSQLYQQSFQKFNDFIFNSKNTYDYKLELLRKIKKIESLSFDMTYLKIFVYGNIDYSSEISKNINKLFNKNPAKIKSRLPEYIKSKADIYEVSDINYALFYWYDFGSFDLKTWSQILVLEVLSNDMAFRVLRTQLQLGYVVFTLSSCKYKRNSLFLVIQGSDIDPKYADWKVKDFWYDFRLDFEEIKQAKSSVKAMIAKQRETFDNYGDIIWKEIVLDRYYFNISANLNDEVDLIEPNDILSIIKTINDEGSQIFIQTAPWNNLNFHDNIKVS